MANKLSEHLDQLLALSKRLVQQAAATLPAGDIADIAAAVASVRQRITEASDASKAAALLECLGRKTFRVALLSLFALTQRLSGDPAVSWPARRSAAHGALQIMWLAYELLNLNSTDAKVAGAKLEVIHYFVRMDAMETYSRLLGGAEEAEAVMAGSEDERERQLRSYAVGGVLLMDAALQASYLASSYSAKCGSCGVTGCGLSNEVFASLERSQLFEHLSRAVFQLAAARQRPGSGDDLALLLRGITDAGLRLVHSRWPPRYTDLQQMSRVLAGPCLQYILSVQLVQMLCAADGGTTYGMAPAAALVPLMPPLVKDDTETVRAAALAALMRVVSGWEGERGEGAEAGAGPSAPVPAAALLAAQQEDGAGGVDGSGTGSGGGAGRARAEAAGEGAAGAAAGGAAEAAAGAGAAAGGAAELDTACAELALVAWMCAHDSQAPAVPLPLESDSDALERLAQQLEGLEAQQQPPPPRAGRAGAAAQAAAQGGSSGAQPQAAHAHAHAQPPPEQQQPQPQPAVETPLRRYQALPPLLSRSAVYALCCRLVAACIASAAAWEARRRAQEQRERALAALPAPAAAEAAPGSSAAADSAAAAPGRAGVAPPAAVSVPAAAPAPPPAPDPLPPAPMARALIPEASCLKVALDALQCATALANNRRRRPPAGPRPAGAFGSSVDDEEELEDLYDCFDAASYMLSMAIMGGVRTTREAPARPPGWWVAAVGVANLAVSRGLRDQAVWDDQCRLRVLRVRLPPLPAVLPAVPPPNVGHAVAAGLVPCLERILRRGLLTQTANPFRVDSLLALVLAWPNLGWFMAYGDPRDAAALVTTVAKLLRQQANAAAEACTRTAASGLAAATATAEAWRLWEPVCKFGEKLLGTGLSMWAWLEQQEAEAEAKEQAEAGAAKGEGQAGGAEGAGSGAGAAEASGPAGPAAAAGAAGVEEGGGEGRGQGAVPGAPLLLRQRPSAASRQLALLVSTATALWLPALSDLARGLSGGNLLEGKDAMTMGRVAVNWSMAVTRACARAQRIAAAGASGGGAADGGVTGAEAAEAAVAAAGYRQLLLRDVRMVELLCEFGKSLSGSWIPQTVMRKAGALVRRAMKQVENLREAISRAHAVVLGEAVELLVDTFPDHMRGAAAAGAAGGEAGGGPGGPQAGARAKRSGSAAAAVQGGAADGSARAGRARAASAGSAVEPAAVLPGPAASLLAVLQELMGPGGLFPKPLLLAKLRILRDGGGGGGDEGAGPSSGGGGAVKPYAGAGDGANVSLLVPPQVGLAVLGTRTCAYPACSCLEYDSELAVPLQGCGRCGRAAYCSRTCQLAHWRAGHKAVCGGGGGGVQGRTEGGGEGVQPADAGEPAGAQPLSQGPAALEAEVVWEEAAKQGHVRLVPNEAGAGLPAASEASEPAHPATQPVEPAAALPPAQPATSPPEQQQQHPSKPPPPPHPPQPQAATAPPSGAPLTEAEARLLTSLARGEVALRGGLPLLEGLRLAGSGGASDPPGATPCAALARIAARLYGSAPLDFKVTAQRGGGAAGAWGSGGGAAAWGRVVECMACPEQAGEGDAAALALLVERMLAAMRDGTGWAL